MGLASFNRMRRMNAAQKTPAKGKAPVKTLEEMNYNELRAMAKDKGIEGYGTMKKNELLKALGSGEKC